jgi:hypothetical protein
MKYSLDYVFTQIKYTITLIFRDSVIMSQKSLCLRQTIIIAMGRAIAQAVSRWLPTAAVRGSKPDIGMWDLWWDKVALGRFSPSTSVSPAIVVRSTNYFTITFMYHPGKMYNRPMCGRSTGTYTILGDLQRDLRGLSPTPPKKNNISNSSMAIYIGYIYIYWNIQYDTRGKYFNVFFSNILFYCT